MNLNFQTEKEIKCFDSLQKYFLKDVSNYIVEVEQLYNQILAQGYTINDISVSSTMKHDPLKTHHSCTGSSTSGGYFYIDTIIKTPHFPEYKKLSLPTSMLNKLKRVPNLQHTKQENEDIIKQNREVEMFLNML
jgi:hypothetical protein